MKIKCYLVFGNLTKKTLFRMDVDRIKLKNLLISIKYTEWKSSDKN